MNTEKDLRILGHYAEEAARSYYARSEEEKLNKQKTREIIIVEGIWTFPGRI